MLSVIPIIRTKLRHKTCSRKHVQDNPSFLLQQPTTHPLSFITSLLHTLAPSTRTQVPHNNPPRLPHPTHHHNNNPDLNSYLSWLTRKQPCHFLSHSLYSPLARHIPTPHHTHHHPTTSSPPLNHDMRSPMRANA
ncbi:hypothetical protein VTJ04DRAFT_10767 [Mycothermus thermophilus]|uniref:uncharacterized protein n=1 Tax=Humicola insolens TaxID=85995 RepID=UPI003741EF47